VNTFLQLLVNGLGKGAVYALLALGFVVIFKATEVVNFAHGSLVLVGGFMVYELKDAVGGGVGTKVGRAQGRPPRHRARLIVGGLARDGAVGGDLGGGEAALGADNDRV